MSQLKRKNILLLFSDQHRGDWMPFGSDMGIPEADLLHMPNIRALMDRGTTFVRAATSSPLCVPARACLALGGEPIPQGDVAYAIELFDGLCIGVQLWHSDEEFPPRLRFLWDENAAMYIKYETMHFAKGLLLQRLEEHL